MPATVVVRRTFMPNCTWSRSGSTFSRLAFTTPPPDRSTIADTYGVGTPRAARCASVAELAYATGLGPVALRGLGVRVPPLARSCATATVSAGVRRAGRCRTRALGIAELLLLPAEAALLLRLLLELGQDVGRSHV